MSKVGKLGSFEGYGVSAGNLGFGSFEGNFGEADAKYLVPIEDTFKWMKSVGFDSEIPGLAPLKGAKIANFLAALPTGRGTYDLVRQSNQDMFKRSISGKREEVSTKNVVIFRPAGAPASSGPGAGEVLTGIAAILAPLTRAGVGIYGAQQAAKADKAARRGGGAPEPDYSQDQQQEAPKSNTGLIIGIVVVILLIGGFMMMQSKQAPMYGPVHRPGYRKGRKK